MTRASVWRNLTPTAQHPRGSSLRAQEPARRLAIGPHSAPTLEPPPSGFDLAEAGTVRSTARPMPSGSAGSTGKLCPKMALMSRTLLTSGVDLSLAGLLTLAEKEMYR